MELVSIKSMPKEYKLLILKEFGYGISGDYVIDNDGKRVKDRYVGVDVNVSNMLIFPGSTIILDNNPLSIAAYLDEYEGKDL